MIRDGNCEYRLPKGPHRLPGTIASLGLLLETTCSVLDPQIGQLPQRRYTYRSARRIAISRTYVALNRGVISPR